LGGQLSEFREAAVSAADQHHVDREMARLAFADALQHNDAAIRPRRLGTTP
jgi:hypothetical protein